MMSEDEHHHELSYPSPPSSMTQAQHQHSNENPIMLRIFAEHAIYSPGVEYKTVPATNSTTALEVIQMVLNKFGEMEPASKFELKYVRINSKTGRVKRRNSLLKLVKGDSDFSIHLEEDICPVLFAEWYSEEPRRFELHRKADAFEEFLPSSKGPSKGQRRRKSTGVFASFRKRASRMHNHVPQPPSTVQLPIHHLGQQQQQYTTSSDQSTTSFQFDHEPSRRRQSQPATLSHVASPFARLQGIQQLSTAPSVASRTSASSAKSDLIKRLQHTSDQSTV
eukprot:m.76173 g.76173  ORF g.76173 m.76173 type:complete len:279 (-) comp8508_c0_seq1:47-883(-)